MDIPKEPSPVKAADLAPGAHIVNEPLQGWQVLDLKEIWQYRELLFFLAWRDIKVRYEQTVLGAAWALLGEVALGVPVPLVSTAVVLFRDPRFIPNSR